MARNVDQIVAELLGNTQLQLAVALSRAEQAEGKVAELAARVSNLEAFKAAAEPHDGEEISPPAADQPA